MEIDRGVLVLKSEKDKLRLHEECSSAPPYDLEELRRAMMLKRDVLKASAEQASQEVLADETATKPTTSLCVKRDFNKSSRMTTICPATPNLENNLRVGRTNFLKTTKLGIHLKPIALVTHQLEIPLTVVSNVSS